MKKYIYNSNLTRRELLKYGVSGLLAMSFTGCSQKKKMPNIILITLDTTRADHLSCYGYNRRITPFLDRLAEESVLYTNAISTSSWTLPSHTSLFTGKFVSSHGVRHDPEGALSLVDAMNDKGKWQQYRTRGLSFNEVTLAATLKSSGYRTASVVGGPWMKSIFGLSKGFDYYDDENIGTLNGRVASNINISALNWIRTNRDSEFFLFLNYFDPHSPYNPPDDFKKLCLPADFPEGKSSYSQEEIIIWNRALYDAEILYMDYYIGQLIKFLKHEKLYDNTLIIITADHGEMIGEHGKFGHGEYLFQDEVHVPLLIKYPGSDVLPRKSEAYLQLIDIFPMIMDFLAMKSPDGIQGRVPPEIDHPIIAETYPLPMSSSDGSWRMLIDKGYKLLWNSMGNHQLFYLKDDPLEKNNLASLYVERVKEMIADLDSYLNSIPVPGPASSLKNVDKDTMDALKSLGYIE
jgi:arylsulfatase A-like enzyme